ncbi:hypothetical protein MMC13_004336 [Lambiella insularis]|nr:hypothetical protein [Lambiella insularis]
MQAAKSPTPHMPSLFPSDSQLGLSTAEIDLLRRHQKLANPLTCDTTKTNISPLYQPRLIHKTSNQDAEVSSLPGSLDGAGSARGSAHGSAFSKRSAHSAFSAYSFSGLSALSKASQVSAGTGMVVKGLKQNLKHFTNTQKELSKLIGLRTKFFHNQLFVSATNLRDAIEWIRRMLEEYMPQAIEFEMGHIDKNAKQLPAVLNQITDLVPVYHASLRGVLVHTASKNEVDKLNLLWLAPKALNREGPSPKQPKSWKGSKTKDRKERSARRRAKEHPSITDRTPVKKPGPHQAQGPEPVEWEDCALCVQKRLWCSSNRPACSNCVKSRDICFYSNDDR